MKILIVGGDKRNLFMIKNFKDKDVDVIGFDRVKGLKNKRIETVDVSNYDIIIFPIDGVHYDYSITAKYNEDEIILPQNFLENAKSNAYIFSGIESKVLKEMANGLNYINLLDYEDVNRENGILTSEGIIANIITNTNHSIAYSNIIIFGNGKVGKPLAKSLRGLKAEVYVGVNETIDYITTENSFYTDQNMKEYLRCANIIINTVPTTILDEENLKYVNKDTYILDISSRPYGIDFISAKKLGLNVNLLSGIPAEIAPESASKILSKKIETLVKES